MVPKFIKAQSTGVWGQLYQGVSRGVRLPQINVLHSWIVSNGDR